MEHAEGILQSWAGTTILDDTEVELACELDVCFIRLRIGDGERAVQDLIEALDAIWARATPEGHARIVEACRIHPVYALLCEEPYASRALAKLRAAAHQ